VDVCTNRIFIVDVKLIITEKWGGLVIWGISFEVSYIENNHSSTPVSDLFINKSWILMDDSASKDGRCPLLQNIV